MNSLSLAQRIRFDDDERGGTSCDASHSLPIQCNFTESDKKNRRKTRRKSISRVLFPLVFNLILIYGKALDSYRNRTSFILNERGRREKCFAKCFHNDDDICQRNLEFELMIPLLQSRKLLFWASGTFCVILKLSAKLFILRRSWPWSTRKKWKKKWREKHLISMLKCRSFMKWAVDCLLGTGW